LGFELPGLLAASRVTCLWLQQGAVQAPIVLAHEPRIKVGVGTGGHFVPREQLVRETPDWLDRYLGPPRELRTNR
jgi:hypothetical protein